MINCAQIILIKILCYMSYRSSFINNSREGKQSVVLLSSYELCSLFSAENHRKADLNGAIGYQIIFKICYKYIV